MKEDIQLQKGVDIRWKKESRMDHFGTELVILEGDEGKIIAPENPGQYLVEFQKIRFYAMCGAQFDPIWELDPEEPFWNADGELVALKDTRPENRPYLWMRYGKGKASDDIAQPIYAADPPNPELIESHPWLFADDYERTKEELWEQYPKHAWYADWMADEHWQSGRKGTPAYRRKEYRDRYGKKWWREAGQVIRDPDTGWKHWEQKEIKVV